MTTAATATATTATCPTATTSASASTTATAAVATAATATSPALGLEGDVGPLPISSAALSASPSSAYYCLGARPKILLSRKTESESESESSSSSSGNNNSGSSSSSSSSSSHSSKSDEKEAKEETEKEAQEKEEEEERKTSQKEPSKRRKSKSPLEFLVKRRRFIGASSLTAAAAAAALVQHTSGRISKALTPKVQQRRAKEKEAREEKVKSRGKNVGEGKKADEKKGHPFTKAPQKMKASSLTLGTQKGVLKENSRSKICAVERKKGGTRKRDVVQHDEEIDEGAITRSSKNNKK